MLNLLSTSQPRPLDPDGAKIQGSSPDARGFLIGGDGMPAKRKQGLTARQKRFVEQYLIHLNATQAALEAGYSKKTAGVLGYQLLQKPLVTAAIQAGKDKRSERTGVSADMVVEQLRRIAFLDIKDVVRFGPGGVTLKPDSDVDGTVLSEVSETTTESGGTIRVKPSDRMKALELLGRHLGMFTDKTEITGKDGGPLQIELSTSDLIDAAKKVAAKVGAPE